MQACFLVTAAALLLLAALSAPAAASPAFGKPRSKDAEALELMGGDLNDFRDVRCDDVECDAKCKATMGYNGGYCNHYRLCSCYRRTDVIDAVLLKETLDKP